nr:MAG TPA: hypothetical protein [Crassvirales sp.]
MLKTKYQGGVMSFNCYLLLMKFGYLNYFTYLCARLIMLASALYHP